MQIPDPQIIHAKKSDLPFIYTLFDAAIVYQKQYNYPVWKGYDKTILQEDVAAHRQYKLIIEEQIACIFSLTYTDKTWTAKDNQNAVFIHRVVVNPAFKGQRQFGKILEWVKIYCKAQKLQYIRMDTWANNPTIIKYYESFGFKIVGYHKNPETEDIPIQQRGNQVVLLEYKDKR